MPCIRCANSLPTPINSVTCIEKAVEHHTMATPSVCTRCSSSARRIIELKSAQQFHYWKSKFSPYIALLISQCAQSTTSPNSRFVVLCALWLRYRIALVFGPRWLDKTFCMWFARKRGGLFLSGCSSPAGMLRSVLQVSVYTSRLCSFTIIPVMGILCFCCSSTAAAGSCNLENSTMFTPATEVRGSDKV